MAPPKSVPGPKYYQMLDQINDVMSIWYEQLSMGKIGSPTRAQFFDVFLRFTLTSPSALISDASIRNKFVIGPDDAFSELHYKLNDMFTIIVPNLDPEDFARLVTCVTDHVVGMSNKNARKVTEEFPYLVFHSQLRLLLTARLIQETAR